MTRGAELWLEGLRSHQELGLGGHPMEDQVPAQHGTATPSQRSGQKPAPGWSTRGAMRGQVTESSWRISSARGDLKCATDTGIILGW